MTTKIMQRLAGKVSVVIMVALLIAAVGTYGLSNSKHDSSVRATAAVSPSKVEAPAVKTAAHVTKDANVNVRTASSVNQAAPVQSASAPAIQPAPPELIKAEKTPLQDARTTYAKLPLSFIPNQGQFEKGVEFEARGSGYIASLTADAAYIGLHGKPVSGQPVKQSIVRVGFAGANAMRFAASEKQSSYANYIGGPASHWKDHVPNFGRVTTAEVYRGIDATFYGTGSNLQFDFVVKPGADPKAIQLKIDGAKATLDANGDLALATELGTIYQRKPVLYQEVNGARHSVEGAYKLAGDSVTFEVGAYDSSRTLTIDPLMNFSLVVGGLADTQLNAVDEDAGAVYVAGTSTSNTLNLTGPSTISGVRAASSQSDAIVVSFTRDGANVNWYTFIGGSNQDTGTGIAVEDQTYNNPPPALIAGFPNAQYGIYVVGQTFSADLANGAGAANAYQGGGDAWAIRLNGNGSLSAGPVYIGGPNGDGATSVAVRCAEGGGCATHPTQDNIYIGMFVGSAVATPTGLSTVGSVGSGIQAGAIVNLRATDLTVPGVGNKGNVLYIPATQSASVTALALTPFPTSAGVLQVAQRLAFVGNVTSPGGLNGNAFAGSVQGGHGGVDGFGFGGGASDGFWGVTNTEHGGGSSRPLNSVFNLDYIGGTGDDNVDAVAILPDGNLVVVGDTNALPFSTTGPNGVIAGGLPVQNTSFGANGLAASGGGRDIVAAIISPAAIGATATATVGTNAAGNGTVGTVATPHLVYGTQAVLANAAAGVQATSTVTAGTTATATINAGTAATLTVTGGVQATAVAATNTISGNLFAVEATGVSVTNLATQSGYWTAPTVTFAPVAPATCTGSLGAPPLPGSLPTGHANIDAAGHITGIVIDSGGVCNLNIIGSISVTIGAPGIQSLAVGGAGSGYQSGTGPLAVTFAGGGCTTVPVATATIGSGSPVATVYPGNTAAAANTNASITGVNVTNFGVGCTSAPTATVATSPGLQSLVINAGGTGYQGGTVVSATFTGGTCTTAPTAQLTVQGVAPNTTLLLDNALTNSGSCSVAPTGVTLTAPGLQAAGLLTGGTGYNTAHTPVVAFNGTCTTKPTVSLTINNVSGNITNETLLTSGVNCTTQPTTETIDAGGITNVQVLNPGSGYNPAAPPQVTVAAPPVNAGHCVATATAIANVTVGGTIGSITVTDPGCGYPTASNPAAFVVGPGVTISGLPSGTGYTGGSISAILPAGFAGTCSTVPTFGTVTVGAVSGSTGGQITGIQITNPGACTGVGTFGPPITFNHTPGIVTVTTTTAGDSYNATAPPATLFFPSCTTQPNFTTALAGAAPNGIAAATTPVSYGLDCTTGAVTYSAPGLKSPGTAFTITSPGLGYATAPTVTVTGCSSTPQATALLAVPPATPGTVGSISLNTLTSGGNGCVNPIVTLTGGTTPGIAALDYLGGTGNDFGKGVSTDANSNIYITGQSFSSNFPVITSATWAGSTALKGTSDGIVARITEAGGTVQGNNGGGFSTYFGGTNNDGFNAITTDQLLNIFLAGQTFSSDFPVTQGAAFSGNSDGTLTNLLFNNMLVTPSTTANFTTTFGTFQPACDAGNPCTFHVNFANITVPFSVAGGPLGGVPGSAVTYSANTPAGNNWVGIASTPGGFTLTVNPGAGSTGLPPDIYSATFIISAPGSDTPPVTFTVKLVVTAIFQTFNCTTPCTVGSTPVSNFNYTYTKAEANASTVTPAQQMLVGLVGLPATTGTGGYPAPGTFTATVNYNTNNALITTGNTTAVATNTNFKWFSIAGGDCSAGCTEPFGTNLALTVNPAVLDTLAESGIGGLNQAAASITFTRTNAGGGGITSITITVTATVTPRVVLTGLGGSNAGGVSFAVSCTGGAPPAPCTTINPSATSNIKAWGLDDVINISSSGNANKLVVLNITNTPPGGSATCFSGAPGGVQIPAGTYQAPSSIDPTATPLTLPVQVNIKNGDASCVQGVYTGTLTISGVPANEGPGDSILTNVTGFAALGPNDAPVATGTVTVGVTITLGNELQSSSTSFGFGTYNIDSQEGLPGSGCTPGATCTNGNPIPANQTGTVSLTLPPGGFNTTYNVKCTVAGIGGLYIPSTGTQTSSSSVTCDWLTASISSSTLSAGSPTATLTVGVTSSGTNNLTVLGTNGGPNGNNYTGSIQLTYTSGTLAGSSLVYPVNVTVVRQPLNWSTSAGGAAPTTTFTTTVGAGVPAAQNCGTLFSTENFIGAGTGEYVAFNPRQVGLHLAALANQTFAAATPATGGAAATVTAGWLTVAQSGNAGGVGSGDTLSCSVNITNLAPGTYTACIDGVDLGPTAGASGPTPAFFAGATDCSNAATGAWPGIGRTAAKVVLNLQASPIITATPTTAGFTFQQGSGSNPANQTVTLTNTSASNVQNVFASSAVNANAFTTATGSPWFAITGATTAAGGITLAGNGTSNITLSIAAAALTGPNALTPGTYNGIINLSCANCTMQPTSIPVSLTVIGTPTITTVPGTLADFVFQQGGPTPATDNLVVNLTTGTGNVTLTPASCATPGVTCTGASWLQVNGSAAASAAQPISTSGIQFSIGVDPAQLNAMAASNTPYTGTVTIAVPGSSNTPVTLAVHVTVIAQPTLVSSPSGTSFSFTVGGTVVPASQTLAISTTTVSGQAANAGFTLTPSSPSNWLLINGVSTAAANTATITPLFYTISVSPAALTTLAAGVPAGSSQTFNGTITIATTTPPASSVTPPNPISYSLTISTQPIINISGCTGSSFAYTLTTGAAVPASITCTVSDSSSVVGINNLLVVGCPASWETCSLAATSLAAGGTTTLTLTPSNLANQNPGTFGPPNITITGASAGPSGGNAITGNVPGISITNTPLTTLTPSGTLTYGPYTQGNLTTPGNQTVAGSLAEGTGGTPSGPGTPGTGTLTSIVAASSFASGACSNGVTAPPNWLAVTQTSTGAGSAAAYNFIVAVNPAVFPTLTTATTCTGAINVNSAGVTPAAVQKVIPVTFTINPQSGFSVSTAAGAITTGGNFTSQYTIVNGYPVNLTSTAAAVPVTVSSIPTQGQQYTVTIQPVTGGNWLTATGCTIAAPCTGNAAAPGFSLGVAGSANTLPAGQYFATVAVASANSSSSPNNTVTFTVTLNVDTTAALSATQTGSLGGPHFQLFTVPPSMTVNVATASASAGAPATASNFTVTQSGLTGATPNNLLVINGIQPFTTTGTATTVPVTITYSATVANSLAPGTYGGNIVVTVTQTGVTTVPQSVSIPWSLVIDSEAAVQTTPTATQGVIINCILGSTCNSTIGLAATSTGLNVNIPVTTSVTSLPTPWLAITASPTTANSTSITVAANTTGLQANTSYAGQIVVTSASAINSPYTVPVTLNVLSTACTFTATNSTVNLTSNGTSTGGVLPEVPANITFTTTGTCGNYSVTSTSATWLTATGGTGVAFTALSNPNSTARSATITITNTGGGSATVTVNEAASTAAEIPNRQVTALYQTILGRDPDGGGYTFWTTSGLPLGTMADDFFTSPEVFNSDFAVMAAYQAATGAPPSYAQFVASAGAIRAGTQTIGGLYTSLIPGSAGYSATTLYQSLLGRTPTSSESTTCTTAGLASCFQTLIGFPNNLTPAITPNNEFQNTGTFNHGTDHTNGLYIRMLYFTILNRDADQGGYNFWLGIANGGGAGILFQGATGYNTRLQILGPGTQGQGFIGSTEFVNDYK